jgi:single-stranded-DNA-specific exonuclease
LELVALLERLEPYGKGNAKPLFLLRDLELAKLDRVGKDQQWMRGVLAVPGTQPLYARTKVDCFGPASAFAGLMRGQRVDAAGSVDRNVWQGKHSVQLRVEAMRPASANREGP